eukprot:scaffold36484_cov229-Amphora_coffeaeformis.AAC.10
MAWTTAFFWWLSTVIGVPWSKMRSPMLPARELMAILSLLPSSAYVSSDFLAVLVSSNTT